MAEIVCAVCETNSFDDSAHHRVKVSCDGVFKQLEVDVVNGIYLRKGDIVYVYTEGTWFDALVLGRCSGQLELQQLVDVINKIIEILNEDKKVFDNHTHKVTSVPALVAGAIPVTGTITNTMLSPSSSFKSGEKIEPDDLLH